MSREVASAVGVRACSPTLEPAAAPGGEGTVVGAGIEAKAVLGGIPSGLCVQAPQRLTTARQAMTRAIEPEATLRWQRICCVAPGIESVLRLVEGIHGHNVQRLWRATEVIGNAVGHSGILHIEQICMVSSLT